MTPEKLVTDPGFESEEAKQRKAYMVKLFNFQASKYDLHDDIIGLGIHRRWIKDLLRIVANYVGEHKNIKMLDLACGTGFVSFKIAKAFEEASIDAFDISPNMIEVAKRRLRRDFTNSNIKFWVSDSEVFFGQEKYDVITTCFAFRNFANKNLATENVFRALKPGGLFVIQDMTKPESGIYRSIYLFALKNILPLAGRMIGTEPGAPHYLYKSVMMMPKNVEIQHLLKSKGFVGVKYKSQSWGMGTVIHGYKPEKD